jgi:hypothetical protein
MVKDPADAKKVMAKLLGRVNPGAKTKSV